MNIRNSRVLRTIRSGGVAKCIKTNLSDPRNVELASMCGFDCVWIDMEHVPTDYMFVENAVRAAKINDCDILTRVAKGSYNDWIRPLEADSTGIMIPHIMSLEEAKNIVYYTKFFPIGRRPLDGGNADGKYGLVKPDTYMREANAERFVVVQIEDPEPMAELEEICVLDGLDMIFFGPADYSQGIGAPCAFENTALLAAREKIAACARRHGKMAGTTGSPATLNALVDMGYNFVSLGADVAGLAPYYQSLL